MNQSVKISTENGLARLELHREHGNAIDDTVVDGLIAACRQIEGDDGIRGVMLASQGKLFCPGLDLQQLIDKDRGAMRNFLARFQACILSMFTMEKPMVAALHGHAVAGGCVLALTADWRVLQEGAKVGLNEVKVGVPFPFGVSMILRSAVSVRNVEEVALFGRNYVGQAAVECGLVHEVQPVSAFEDACRARLDELATKDLYAFRTTKRYLRSATVERIRQYDSQFMDDFLDGWFSESTQGRIREIAAQLSGTKPNS